MSGMRRVCGHPIDDCPPHYGEPMTDPIPVKLARRACEEMLRIAKAATPKPWKQDPNSGYIVAEVPKGRPGGGAIVHSHCRVLPDRPQEQANAAFTVAQRATSEALWECVWIFVRYPRKDAVQSREAVYAPIAAALSHLDAAHPGWREEGENE